MHYGIANQTALFRLTLVCLPAYLTRTCMKDQEKSIKKFKHSTKKVKTEFETQLVKL